MNIKIKKYLPLMLIASLFTKNSFVKASDNIFQDVMCVGGTILAGGFIGSCLYNAFRKLTDKEEINRADRLCSKADDTLNNVSTYYARPISYFKKYNKKSRVIRHLTRHIQNKGFDVSVFIDYEKELDIKIYNVSWLIDKVHNKIKHLERCSACLVDKVENHQISRRIARLYSKQYDSFIISLSEFEARLNRLYKKLKRLHRYVKNLPEYREAVLLDQLERERERNSRRIKIKLKKRPVVKTKIKAGVDLGGGVGVEYGVTI